MRKRTIPFLVGTMTLALLGIIFIQYKWIEESFDEKQKLVEHKVYEMVDNIDQHLNDMNTLAFISASPGLESAFQHEVSNTRHLLYENELMDSTLREQLSEPFDLRYCDTIFSGDSMIVTYNRNFIDSLTGREMKFRIQSVDEIGPQYNTTDVKQSDSIVIILQNEQTTNILGNQLKDVSSMLRRVQLEVGSSNDNYRLDSLKLANMLISESEALGLISPADWCVYDNQKKDYIINPKKEQTWDYELSLFKKDIIYPNRYFIRLEMGNMKTFIWKEISVMIVMSLLFIAIITFVFIYSIRLTIKHKKISEIKSDFINNMTHEFKTPLASISLAADSIIHPKVRMDPEKIDHYISIIKMEKTKLNQHIETILEIASLKENDLPIELTKVDLNACLHDSVAKLRLLILDKACDIHFDLEPETFVYANAYHLENVFSNLIENGIKYSSDIPKITLHSRKKGNLALVYIKDEGIGMTKEQLNRAFDHFYRAQKGNIHNTKGFGLGLSFVKYLIHKMNSTIKIESELNKGTTIFIEFPLCP